MKVALSTKGEDLRGALDARFGRAPRFLIYDLETRTFELIDNGQNLNAAQGAGIQSAQKVVRSGAECLVTGHCGPKAFQVLSAAGVKVYTTDAATLEEAIEKFQAGQLSEMQSADVEGHWA